MEVKAINVIVERDPMTKIPKQIPAWELDIYEAKYPGKIEVVGESTITLDDLPDAESEAARLRVLHGGDAKTEIPYFDDVYGRGRAGVAEFEKAVHAARVRAAKHSAKHVKATPGSDDGKASDDAGSKDTEGSGEPKDPLSDPA